MQGSFKEKKNVVMKSLMLLFRKLEISFLLLGFKGLSLSCFVIEWITSISLYALALASFSLDCKPPPLGILKLNFYGSFMGNPKPSGFGCVILDYHSLVFRIITSSINHGNSNRVEVLSLFMGLHEFKKIEISHSCIGDSKVMIEWGLGFCMGYRKYASFIHEIRDLGASLNISISYVSRSQNSL